MNLENHEQRIAKLESVISAITPLGAIMSRLVVLSDRERQDRLEMCKTIFSQVVEIKNSQAMLCRMVAELPSADRQAFLNCAAKLESACERLELAMRAFEVDQACPPSDPPPSQG